QLLALPDFATLSRPHAAEHHPSYIHLARAHRLLMLQCLQQEPAAAAAQLHEYLAALRRRLGDSDELLGKMIWLHLIGDHIEVLWRVTALLPPAERMPLAALDSDERDLTRALAREFA